MMNAVCTLTTETPYSLDTCCFFLLWFLYIMIYSAVLTLGVRTLEIESKISFFLCVSKNSQDVNKRFLAFI